MTLLNSTDPAALRRRKLGALRVMPYRLHKGTISISSGLERSYTSVFGTKGNLGVIWNGLDLERYRPLQSDAKTEIRRQLGLDPRLRYCIFVGRISHRKGVDIIVRAWSRVIRCCPQARLILVGPTTDEHRYISDPSFAERIRAEIERLHLDPTIIWVGRSDGVEKYLQASDVFVFASRREGFGTAMAEAMACGLPVVSVRIPDVTDDLVTPGTNGILTAPDPTALANGICTVLRCPETARVFGNAGRRKAEECFSIGTTARRYADVLGRL
jgi:glycosyltransferase involved in cell wall biosynthesis